MIWELGSTRGNAGRAFCVIECHQTERETTMKDQLERGGVVAYRAPAELLAALDRQAASEGISRSDVARRAAIQVYMPHIASNALLEGADA